ncbi:MAG: hypothetical protein UT02_C0048G0015 [Parcubacteria group bacterium GW2011_GWC2_38_7]|nr:MAG: hypothetical protein UT02_C0048G0015 [Parcubacteria group bacterium GW2011_GWC2_38_7]
MGDCFPVPQTIVWIQGKHPAQSGLAMTIDRESVEKPQ